MIIDRMDTKCSIAIGGMRTVLLVDAEIPDSFLFWFAEFETSILEISREYKILGFFVLCKELSFSEVGYEFLVDKHSFDFDRHKLEINERVILFLNSRIIYTLFPLRELSIGNEVKIEILFVKCWFYLAKLFVSLHSEEHIGRLAPDEYKLLGVDIFPDEVPRLAT